VFFYVSFFATPRKPFAIKFLATIRFLGYGSLLHGLLCPAHKKPSLKNY